MLDRAVEEIRGRVASGPSPERMSDAEVLVALFDVETAFLNMAGEYFRDDYDDLEEWLSQLCSRLNRRFPPEANRRSQELICGPECSVCHAEPAAGIAASEIERHGWRYATDSEGEWRVYCPGCSDG
jgi:hypothetical protein